MSVVDLVLRGLLAAVLLLSSLSKLGGRSFAAFVHSVGELTGARAPRLLGLVTVVAEMTLAVGLVLPQAAGAALVGSNLLLLGFTGVLVVAALRGNEVSCRCFGGLSAGPVGPTEIARNCGLLLLVIAAMMCSPDLPRPVALGMALGTILLLAGGALVSVAFLARALRTVGIPIGGAVTGEGPGTEMYRLGSTLAVREPLRPTLVGVLSTTCPPCLTAAPVYDRFARHHGLDLLFLVDDARGEEGELFAELARLDAPYLALSAHPELEPANGIRPGWAVIDAGGVVGASGIGMEEMHVPSHV